MKVSSLSILYVIVIFLLVTPLGVLSVACANRNDILALQSKAANPTKLITKCSSKCRESKDSACYSSCFKRGLKISQDCANCFADYGSCAGTQCAEVCATGGSAECAKCSQESECFKSFQTCAFTPIRVQ
eukprot:TRINITY_DN307_c0_g1_i1.p1 TRINITY_DN307_c0_g1~~TRINITY_DN307_c0_g1_i1.p1  ORF type:complete len:130 (+),score=20.69 TRINITY_DN307_c0_g1_i1:126-515(+)